MLLMALDLQGDVNDGQTLLWLFAYSNCVLDLFLSMGFP